MNNVMGKRRVFIKVDTDEKEEAQSKQGCWAKNRFSIMRGVFAMVSGFPAIFIVIVSLFVYIGHVVLGIFGTHEMIYHLFALETLAVTCLLYLLIMHAFGCFEYSEVKHSDVITSAGIMVLAAGAAFFHGVELYTHSTMALLGCYLPDLGIVITNDVVRLALTALQVLFLINHRGMIPGKSYWLRGCCQIAASYLVVYNLTRWIFSIGDEAQMELSHIEHASHDASNDASHDASYDASHDTSYDTSHDQHTSYHGRHVVVSVNITDLGHICDSVYGISPLFKTYTIPLEVEFSVFALSLYLSLLKRCKFEDPEIEQESSSSKEKPMALFRPDSVGKWQKFCEKWEAIFRGQGLFCGWLVLIFTIMLILCGLYNFFLVESLSGREWMDYQVYGAHLVLTVFTMTGICLAIPSLMAMRSVSAKKAIPPFRRDRLLLTATGIFLFFYKVMTLAAGILGHHPLILAESVLCIIHGMLQMVFINWFLVFKRPAYVDQSEEKPGHQALGFLRWTCAAHWLMNTFLLKNLKTHEAMDEVFGMETFAIISSVLMPMVILFYFHSLMFISELMDEVYSVDDFQELEGPSDKFKNLMYRKRSIVNFNPNVEYFDSEISRKISSIHVGSIGSVADF